MSDGARGRDAQQNLTSSPMGDACESFYSQETLRVMNRARARSYLYPPVLD